MARFPREVKEFYSYSSVQMLQRNKNLACRNSGLGLVCSKLFSVEFFQRSVTLWTQVKTDFFGLFSLMKLTFDNICMFLKQIAFN